MKKYIIMLLMVYLVTGALYEAGTYWKPVNSSVGYIMGENRTFDLVLLKSENITFNSGSDFITFNLASGDGGNITIFNISTNYINHTCDFNANVEAKVSGLNWATSNWNIYTGSTPTFNTSDQVAPLNFTLDATETYAQYTSAPSTTSTTTTTTTTSTSTTTLPNINASSSTAFAQFVYGYPFQAAVTAETTVLGGLFWGMIIGIIYISIWLRTQSFAYPTLFLISFIAVFNNADFIHPVMHQAIYATIVLSMVIIIFRGFASNYTK